MCQGPPDRIPHLLSLLSAILPGPAEGGVNVAQADQAPTGAQQLPTPLAASPQFLEPDASGASGPVWVPSKADFELAQQTASLVCLSWGGSLLTMTDAAVGAALTASLDKGSTFWTGLHAIDGVWRWTGLNATVSAAALQHYSPWCGGLSAGAAVPLPEAFGRGTAAAAAAAASATSVASAAVVPMCSLLRYDSGRCSGWGWDTVACSETNGYACQLSATGDGLNGQFYCVESYALAGVTVGTVQQFGPATPTTTAATYCADACRALGSCSGFVLDDEGDCTMLSRAGKEGADVVDDSVAVACLKHSLMWDTLGAEVAVSLGVAKDIAVGYRCLQDQLVSHVELGSRAINSCSISDCSALCFANVECTVAIYDARACR